MNVSESLLPQLHSRQYMNTMDRPSNQDQGTWTIKMDEITKEFCVSGKNLHVFSSFHLYTQGENNIGPLASILTVTLRTVIMSCMCLVHVFYIS